MLESADDQPDMDPEQRNPLERVSFLLGYKRRRRG
jgi:hypothetical protein